jgi:alanyl-tRNA synthetase
MGLERLASVLQQVASNYDTDLFAPIHARLREMLGHDPETFEQERFSYQVIADHVRAITFLVADGVLPGNEGRGYVLRRIVRRAVRHGRLLGRRKPFLAELAPVVVETMAGAYPYLLERRGEIEVVTAREERAFARTLEAGSEHLAAALADLAPPDAGIVGRRAEELAAAAPILPGEVAFRLHDTYGFPVDLTVELAAERGVAVDRARFETALAGQRQRSRRGRKADLARRAEAGARYEEILRGSGGTTFLGYETTQAGAHILALLRDGEPVEALEPGESGEVVLDRTPFYPEGGGQVGDRGVLEASGRPAFTVEDTQRVAGPQVGGLIVHRGTAQARLARDEAVVACVDAERRARTMRNHTATHLLHRALRDVVGESARQAGSLVGPDYLRFDFPLDRPLTAEEKRAIEAEVRRVIRKDQPVEPHQMTMAEALAAGADAFFDEKYGERVRVVSVDDFSRELCGGTHCHATGQVGSFAITGERSIGAGLRRIEALTAAAADAWLDQRVEALERTAAALGAHEPTAAPERAAELQGRVKELEKRLRQGGATNRPQPAELAAAAKDVGPGRLVARALELDSMDELKSLARAVRAELPSGVIALGLEADEPQLFVTVSPDLVERGVSAGDLVRTAAEPMGGRGGGRPEMAQGRGTRREGLAPALEALRRALAATG